VLGKSLRTAFAPPDTSKIAVFHESGRVEDGSEPGRCGAAWKVRVPIPIFFGCLFMGVHDCVAPKLVIQVVFDLQQLPDGLAREVGAGGAVKLRTKNGVAVVPAFAARP
jgi:hypothetical protein